MDAPRPEPLAQAPEGRGVLNIWPLLLAAAGGRLLVGLGLYLWAWRISPARPLAVLSSWLLALDAAHYHGQALKIMEFWRGGPAELVLSLPDRYLGYPMLLGGVYYLLGPHPLWGLLVNSLAFLGVGWLAHGLALRLGQPPGRALALALLVALWPPSLAYSSALLKDSLSLLAVFGLLAALAGLLEQGERNPRRWAGWGLGLLAAGYLLVVLRPELAALALGAGLAGGAWTLAWAWRAPGRTIWRVLAVCLLVALAVGAGRELTPVRFVPHATKGSQVSKALRSAASAGISVQAPTTRPEEGPAPATGLAPLPAPPASFWSELWQRRWEYAQTGGISLAPQAFLLPEGPGEAAAILGGALQDLLLFPWPWQRWPSGGGNIALRAVVVAQALFWYALLPGLLWGAAVQVSRGTPATGVVLAWALTAGLLLALVIVNLGTLYRARDLALLPLLLCFSPQPYRWLARGAGLLRGARQD